MTSGTHFYFRVDKRGSNVPVSSRRRMAADDNRERSIHHHGMQKTSYQSLEKVNKKSLVLAAQPKKQKREKHANTS